MEIKTTERSERKGPVTKKIGINKINQEAILFSINLHNTSRHKKS